MAPLVLAGRQVLSPEKSWWQPRDPLLLSWESLLPWEAPLEMEMESGLYREGCPFALGGFHDVPGERIGPVAF